MPALTRARLEAASNGFRALFLDAFDADKPDWHDIAMEVPSSAAQESYNWTTGMPGIRELIGEADVANLSTAEFSIRNKEWHDTVGVKRADIERDTLGITRPRFGDLGRAAADHPRLLLAGLLSAGFASQDYTGLAFFAANKPYNPDDKSKGALKFTNLGTGVLNAANFVTARTSLKRMTDSKGNNLGLGKKLTLVVPPELEEVAKKLRTAENISVTGGSTETNTLKDSFEVKVINELTSATAWFLMESGREIKPLVVQMEVRPEFNAAIDLTDPQIMLKQEYLYQAYYRGNAGYGLSQLCYGSTGAG